MEECCDNSLHSCLVSHPSHSSSCFPQSLRGWRLIPTPPTPCCKFPLAADCYCIILQHNLTVSFVIVVSGGTNTQTPASTAASGTTGAPSLFGNSNTQAKPAGGLFGGAGNTQQQPQSTGSNMFSGLGGQQQKPAGGGLFGGSTTTTTSQPQAGGLFGGTAGAGNNTASTGTTGGGLFGGGNTATQTQSKPLFGGLGGSTTTGGGLL